MFLDQGRKLYKYDLYKDSEAVREARDVLDVCQLQEALLGSRQERGLAVMLNRSV